MKLKTLTTAMILATVPMTGAFAAALDRSGQSISAFLQPGNYFEAGISVLDPDVSGQEAGTSATNRQIGDMAGDYYFPSAALKFQLTDNFSFGLLYDQPFGADAEYSGNNVFVAAPTDRVLSSLPITTTAIGGATTGSTSVEVDTQNISMIFGFQPTENFNIYGGGVYQTIKGNVKLRGSAYSVFNGYNANIKEDSAAGWLAGFAYQIPEIALKASVTYRSEIDHKTTIHEDVPLADLLGIDYSHQNSGTITTPESINLNLQTGLNATTAVYAKVRYVPWGDFAYYPPVLKASTTAALGKGLPLVDYSEDQTSVELGVGKRLTPKLAISVSGLWDSGAGDPAPTLGPVNGYWGAGLAAKYNINQKLAFSVGGRYMWFGDAEGETSDRRIVGEFEDNTGYIVGMKLSYKSK